jgi:hypothetical protein
LSTRLISGFLSMGVNVKRLAFDSLALCGVFNRID